MDNIGRRDRKTALAAQLHTDNSRRVLSDFSHFYDAGLLAANAGSLSDSTVNESVGYVFNANNLSLAISINDSAYPLRPTADTVQFFDVGWRVPVSYGIQEQGFNPNRFFFETDGSILNFSVVKKDSTPISGGGFGGTGHGPFAIASHTSGDGGIAGTGNTGGSGDGGIAGTGNTGGSGDGGIAGTGNTGGSGDGGIAGPDNAPDSSGTGTSGGGVPTDSVPLPDGGSGRQSNEDTKTKAVTGSSTESDAGKDSVVSGTPQLAVDKLGGKFGNNYIESILHETDSPALQMAGNHLTAHISYTPIDHAPFVSEIFPV